MGRPLRNTRPMEPIRLSGIHIITMMDSLGGVELDGHDQEHQEDARGDGGRHALQALCGALIHHAHAEGHPLGQVELGRPGVDLILGRCTWRNRWWWP